MNRILTIVALLALSACQGQQMDPQVNQALIQGLLNPPVPPPIAGMGPCCGPALQPLPNISVGSGAWSGAGPGFVGAGGFAY